MNNRQQVRVNSRLMIEDSRAIQILDPGNVFPSREPALASDIANDPEIHSRFAEAFVQVFHDENSFGCIRQVLAVLLVSTDKWLIDLEVSAQVIDLDDTQVRFLDHAAVRVHRILHEPECNHAECGQESRANHQYVLQRHAATAMLPQVEAGGDDERE